MANYLDENIHQTVFLDVNYLEVLGNNTFEASLYKLTTEMLDLSAFDASYKNNKVGRKAYSPALLLRVIFYGYYRGMTSSRAIANACETDLKFMALAAGRTPHFTTIADFVSSHCLAMKDLFHKVLVICSQSGLIGKKHFAIDGCKLPSDASKQWSGTHKQLQKRADKMRKVAGSIVDKHQDNDNTKNDSDNERRLRTADTLLKNAQRIDEFLGENDRRMGVGKTRKEVQSNVTDNDSAKMQTAKGAYQGFNCQAASDELYQVVVSAEAYGVGQDQSLLKPMVENIREAFSFETDNIFAADITLTADTGYSSEENMRYLFDEKINAVVPDHGFRQRDPRIVESDTYQDHKQHRQKTRKDRGTGVTHIPASEFRLDEAARTCICPEGYEMLYLGDHFKTNQHRTMRFRGKLPDCRACPRQSECMQKPIKSVGRNVSFPVTGSEKVSHLDRMRAIIDSTSGRLRYAKRMWTIEPVFANITSNKRLNKLSLRGKDKVTCQWQMFCMVHNIEKLWRYG